MKLNSIRTRTVSIHAIILINFYSFHVQAEAITADFIEYNFSASDRA